MDRGFSRPCNTTNQCSEYCEIGIRGRSSVSRDNGIAFICSCGACLHKNNFHMPYLCEAQRWGEACDVTQHVYFWRHAVKAAKHKVACTAEKKTLPNDERMNI